MHQLQLQLRYSGRSVRFTMQDDLNEPEPSQPGAKCRQTVVAGSARCIFMILFFLIGHRGKEEVSSVGRNASPRVKDRLQGTATQRDRAHTNRDRSHFGASAFLRPPSPAHDYRGRGPR